MSKDSSEVKSFDESTLGHQMSEYDPTPGSAVTATYDVAGHMAEYGSPDLCHDHQNRLVHMDHSGTSNDKWFCYDALGRRVAEKKGSFTENLFFYSGPHIIEETNSDLDLERVSLFGVKHDEVIYSGRTHNDGNGSLTDHRWPPGNHFGSMRS